MISKYAEHIKNSGCYTNEQSKFMYNAQRWEKLNTQLKKEVQDVENTELNRIDIIDAFKEYFAGKSNLTRPLLLAFIWGFSDTGYGTFRTNKYLSNETHIDFFKSAMDAVKENEIEKAFKLLKKVDGLGISYLSKILYFATRAAGIKDYVMIYDIRVARSLVLLTAPKEISDIISVGPSDKFSDYMAFNKMMHDLGSKYKLEPENIEMFLFEQKF